MKKSQIVYEIAVKAFPEFSAQESLNESSIVGILNEDLSNADIKKLRAVITETLKAIQSSLSIAKEYGMKALAEYLNKMISSLREASKLATQLDLEADPEGTLDKIKDFFGGKSVKIQDALQVVMSLENKASVAINAIADSLDFVTDNLEGKDIEDGTTIKDISPDILGAPVEKLQQAIADKIKKSIQKPEGMMGKMLKYFSREDDIKKLEIVLGADVELDPVAIAKDVMNLNYSQLKGTAEQTQETAAAAEDSQVDTSAAENIVAADDSEETEESGNVQPKPNEIYNFTSRKGRETFVLIREEPDGEWVSASTLDGKGGFKSQKFNVKIARLGEKATPEEAGISEENRPATGDPEVESDPTEKIKAVASEAEASRLSPKDAVSKALEDWEKSLSASSQQTLRRKKRNVALKDAIFTGIDKGTAAVKKAVAKAVKDWRSEHEEIMIKGKRFAKKNFDSLEQLIPDLTAQVLARTQESNRRKITVTEIRKFVFNKLNREFNSHNVLYEKWVKNAGLLKD